MLAGVAMFLLVFPLAQGHSLGWPAWLYAMLAASVLVLAAFGWYQVRRQRAGRDPLVEPSLFRHGPYRAGIVFSIVFTGSLGGIVMIFNVFLQNGLGFSPWHSAITTAPWAAGAFIGSAAGGIAMSKLGRRVLHAGLVVEAAGLLGSTRCCAPRAAASPPWTCWPRWWSAGSGWAWCSCRCSTS